MATISGSSALEPVTFEAPVPGDMESLLAFLREGGAVAPETLAEEMGVAEEGEAEEEILPEEEEEDDGEEAPE